jgi:hypothetical protein
MMEAVHTFETSVCYDETTWRCIPEGYHLHTHYCENLKPHICFFCYHSSLHDLTSAGAFVIDHSVVGLPNRVLISVKTALNHIPYTGVLQCMVVVFYFQN